jgi:amino acid transporter
VAYAKEVLAASPYRERIEVRQADVFDLAALARDRPDVDAITAVDTYHEYLAEGEQKIVGLLFGTLTFFCFYSVVIMIRETRHSAKKEVPFSMVRAGMECFRNPSFPPFVLAASCSTIGIEMAVAVIPFLVKVVIRSTEFVAGLTQGIIVILAACFSLWLTSWLKNTGRNGHTSEASLGSGSSCR